MRGKSEVLSDDEQRRATRFAAIVTHSSSFLAVQSVSGLAGMILGQVSLIFFPPRGADPNSAWSPLTLASLLIALAIVLPITLRTRARARRWAAAHSQL